MRSRTGWLVALVLLAGCRVEGSGWAAARSRDSAVDRAAPPAGHRVFNRRREDVAPGVVRVTLSAVVPVRYGQDSAQRIIEAVVAEERGRDTAAAAIRVLAYFPPSAGHGQREASLVPLAFADWAPLSGWDRLSAATAGGPHRLTTTFLHDAETMRALGADTGMAPPGGMPRSPASPPGGTMPMPPSRPQ